MVDGRDPSSSVASMLGMDLFFECPLPPTTTVTPASLRKFRELFFRRRDLSLRSRISGRDCRLRVVG